MYYTLGDTTLHFYRYQCKFYVAHWEGGNVMDEKFKPFIEQITEKTGLDAKRVETAALTWINRQPVAVYQRPGRRACR